MENKFGKLSKLQLTAAVKNGKTILEDVAFTAPFKIMRPYYEQPDVMTVMQQTASAGTMSGDRQEIEISVKTGAQMKVVSQAYEKIHKMKEGFASRETTIHVASGAMLHHMPLPVIPFSGSDFRSKQTIHLEDENAKFIFQEILSCGRVAHGEQFGYRSFTNRVEIYKGKRLVYLDNTNYKPETMEMAGYGMYEGYTHLASMVICNYEISEKQIQEIREKLDAAKDMDGGVTLTAYGDLVIRVLGKRADDLRTLMGTFLWSH